MPIGEFCNREVVIADPATPVADAARLMREHHVGCLVVVESAAAPRPIGVVTDRDLVIEVLARTETAAALTIGDLLTTEVATARSEVGVFENLRYMREHGYRRMPVVDAAGLLVGIVTLDDYVALLAEEMGELARLIDAERRHEGKLRP